LASAAICQKWGGYTIVVSPSGVLDFIIRSNTESDPFEDFPSSDHTLVAPGVSPFLYDDYSESEPLEDLSEEDTPKPREATIAR
nr:hypothetical protein [Tanacetum cinerariifolium]